MVWRSYVAMGDRVTEGLDDPYPDGGPYPGWAGRAARRPAGRPVVRRRFRQSAALEHRPPAPQPVRAPPGRRPRAHRAGDRGRPAMVGAAGDDVPPVLGIRPGRGRAVGPAAPR